MHLLVALTGTLEVRHPGGTARTAGVVTAPDVAHAIDGRGAEILLVFFDPESEAGLSLRAVLDGPVRLLPRATCRKLAASCNCDPMAIMQAGGVEWTAQLVSLLGGESPAPRRLHPRVRRLLRQLQQMPPEADASLESLARIVGLSPGRLMHAFTESIGVPLRPYLLWLKLQRAAAAITQGQPLSDAAVAAGFADAAHMSRTFKKMLGLPPSALRQPVAS
jgi:AraC-like DNA-binding protein